MGQHHLVEGALCEPEVGLVDTHALALRLHAEERTERQQRINGGQGLLDLAAQRPEAVHVAVALLHDLHAGLDLAARGQAAAFEDLGHEREMGHADIPVEVLAQKPHARAEPAAEHQDEEGRHGARQRDDGVEARAVGHCAAGDCDPDEPAEPGEQGVAEGDPEEDPEAVTRETGGLLQESPGDGGLEIPHRSNSLRHNQCAKPSENRRRFNQ